MNHADQKLLAQAVLREVAIVREQLHMPDLAAQAQERLNTSRRLASHIADALAKINPRFDRYKFMRDCGLDP